MAAADNGKQGGILLSAEDMRFYDDNGYLLVKNVVPKHKVQQYVDRFKQICQKQVRNPLMTVMKDINQLNKEFGEDAVNKIQDFYDDPVLFDYCRLPQITTMVGDLVGGRDLMAMHTMLINKPPDSGSKSSRHPMHQDLHYFPFRPAGRICCAWSALEPVHRANGCLVVVPGSHKSGQLLEHGYPQWEGGVNKMYHGVIGFDPREHESSMAHVEMDTGDTLFFHPLLLHGSGANTTGGYRKAISCHYADGAACDYVDVAGTSQQNIADEVRQLVRSKFGDQVHIDYRDVWRLRGKLVAGVRCNL